MSDIDPEALGGERLSYSYRAEPEMPGQVWWNRISMTAGLFATAVGAMAILGRKR